MTVPGIQARGYSVRRPQETGTACSRPWRPNSFRVHPDQVVEIVACLIEHADADALVQAMEAAAIGIEEHAGEAIGRNARRSHEGGVRGADLKLRDHRYAGPALGGFSIDGVHDFR